MSCLLLLRLSSVQFSGVGVNGRLYSNTACVCEMKLIGQVPLELLELILMRAFVMLYVHHYKTAIICAGEKTYSTLARVSFNWWQTLDGWPASDTRLWLKHQIVKRLES